MENFYGKEYMNLVRFSMVRFNFDFQTAQDIVQQAFIACYEKVDWTKEHSKIKSYILCRIYFLARNNFYYKQATGLDFDAITKYRNVSAEADMNSLDVSPNESSLLPASEDLNYNKVEVEHLCETIKKTLKGVTLEVFNLIRDETMLPYEMLEKTMNKVGRFSVQKNLICETLNISSCVYYRSLDKIREAFSNL